MSAKQVIVVRKDLNMRKGKMIAQGAHVVAEVIWQLTRLWDPDYGYRHEPKAAFFEEWRYGDNKKIVVSVNSEAELEAVYQKALTAGMPTAMATDIGLTEFKGKLTKTAVAIGPWDEAEINKITGELPLL